MSFQLLYELLFSPVQFGSGWYNPSLSKRRAMAQEASQTCG